MTAAGVPNDARLYYEDEMRNGAYKRTWIEAGARFFEWETTPFERAKFGMPDVRLVWRIKLPYRKPTWTYTLFDEWNPKPLEKPARKPKAASPVTRSPVAKNLSDKGDDSSNRKDGDGSK